MAKPLNIEVHDSGSLVIRFDGKLASSAALSLDAFAASVRGWDVLFRILGSLYQNSIGELRGTPNRELLVLEIRAQQPGSYEVWVWVGLAVAAGTLGNRADALVVWSFKKFIAFCRAAINSFIKTKRQTANVDQIVAALEQMTAQHQIILELSPPEQAASEEKPENADESPAEQSQPKRAIVEKINSALCEATEPLDRDCERIELSDSTGNQIAAFDQTDREAIQTTLELPPPEGIWRQRTIRFERLNRKTGRALIYFGEEVAPTESASYARIVDPSVHKAGDPYTAALYEDTPLTLWARQVRGEKGRLNLMWELTVRPPEQLALFGPEGSRA